MKITETLFEVGNYETPKKLNRSNRIVSNEILKEVEEGITSERLDELRLPVFKYKTQITIHGQFPQVERNYLDGYKQIFQNQNGSIGVKYNAIDNAKKERLYRYLKMAGYSVSKNSTTWEAYEMGPAITTKEQYEKRLAEVKEKIQSIDKSLYFGSINAAACNLWGTVYIVAFVKVRAIYEKNLERFIVQLTGKSSTEIQIAYTERKEKEKAEYEAQMTEMRKAQEQREQKHRAMIQEAKNARLQEFTDAGYVPVEKYPPQPGDRAIAFVVVGEEVRIRHFWFDKEPRQKMMRMFDAYSDSLDAQKPAFGSKISDRKVLTGYVLKAKQPEKQPETKILSSEISVIDYSDKAIAVMGNTYPIKDQLKKLGARFNRNLKGGPGWILPVSKKSEVLKIKKP